MHVHAYEVVVLLNVGSQSEGGTLHGHLRACLNGYVLLWDSTKGALGGQFRACGVDVHVHVRLQVDVSIALRTHVG